MSHDKTRSSGIDHPHTPSMPVYPRHHYTVGDYDEPDQYGSTEGDQ